MLLKLAAYGQDKDATFGNERSKSRFGKNLWSEVNGEAGYAVAARARLGMADRLAVNASDQDAVAVWREGQARLSG